MCIITGPTNIANNSSFIIANISSSIALNFFEHIQMIQLQKFNLIFNVYYVENATIMLQFTFKASGLQSELTWFPPWINVKHSNTSKTMSGQQKNTNNMARFPISLIFIDWPRFIYRFTIFTAHRRQIYNEKISLHLYNSSLYMGISIAHIICLVYEAWF